MKIGKLTYNGKTAESLGVFVSGAGTYNAAEEDVTAYEVPGRNGDILVSNNRYKNIDVTYPAFIPSDFEERVQAIRNWMRSARSYARIEDNYDLLHFRMGVGKEILSFSPAQQNRAANCQLVFNCKPQRFLYSGEEDFAPGEWGPTETLSGDIVSFENDGNKAFKSLTLPLSPVQSFNGYSGPWPGGAGKNKLPNTETGSTTGAGVTWVSNDIGEITCTGTPTATAYRNYGHVVLPAGTYTVTGIPETAPTTGSRNAALAVAKNDYYGSGANMLASIVSPTDTSGTFTIEEETDVYLRLYVYTTSGTITDFVFRPMIRLASEADDTWEPYENICPVSGHDGANVTAAGKNLLNGVYTNEAVNASGVISSSPTARLSGFIPVGTSDFVASVKHMEGASNNALRVLAYDENKNFLTRLMRSATDSDGYIVTTRDHFSEPIRSEMRYVRVNILITTEYIDTWRVEFGTERTEDGSLGTLYPVTWSEAGTVYGGEVDIVSGELTVTHRMANMGDISWNYDASSDTFYAAVSGKKAGLKNVISSLYATSDSTGGAANIEEGEIRGMAANARIAFRDSRFPKQSGVIAELDGVQMLYELASPQTYQLTPTQVLTLLGANNVWSDTGPVEAEIGENPNVLVNPTLFDALPVITLVNPERGATVTVGEYTLTCLEAYSGTVTIDCENEDIYSGPQNLNNKWSGSFPVLKPGNNPASISGTTGTIKPRWWEL